MNIPTKATKGRTVDYKPGMAPVVTETPAGRQIDAQGLLAAHMASLPAMYRHLTVEDLPRAQTQKVREWLEGTNPGLWLGGASWRGKSLTGFLVVGGHAAEHGRTFQVIAEPQYREAKRGIQTPEEARLIRRAETVHFLVLDDWASALNPGKDLDYLRDLLTRRAARNLRTVITANYRNNLSQELLAHPDGAVRATAEALNNRIKAMTAVPYPSTLPELPAQKEANR